jgi:cell division protein FtsB
VTYNLKRSKGGINAEKVYEFGMNVPLSKKGRTDSIIANQKKQNKGRNPSSAAVQRRKTEAALRVVALRRQEKERAAIARRRAEIAESEQNIRTVRSATRVPLPTAVIFMSLVCTVLFMYIIFNIVQISEKERVINSMEDELSTLDVEKNKLQGELEKKNDLNYIGDYALNKLGMVKSDQLSRQYVNLQSEDKIEIVSDSVGGTGDNLGGLTAIIKSARTKLSELWEYIS